MVNTILKEADLFCPNSVRINFTIYHLHKIFYALVWLSSVPIWWVR
ncbi:ABC transporter ATP-binding protein [Pediococcus pentosaceus]|nr:ABC transporter ATP-binding protein [Pediococcus pentosaceus]